MYHYNQAFINLLKRDRRYKAEAYAFVSETLEYAQNTLHLGKDEANEPLADDLCLDKEELEYLRHQEAADTGPKNHISGQDLCHAAKKYALEQYGYLARAVLNSIGIKRTEDIGEIVFNLISIGQMRKTPQDQREDFANVFDFEEAFSEKYQIK